MPFRLANIPAIFQAYINHVLLDLLDKICVIYLDNIFIFLKNDAEYIQYIRIVLDRLRQYKLYANSIKYQFKTEEINFLEFIINIKGVYIKTNKIFIIIK
jgi:Reverse transcriptase (RNA-dependent DNA polymerase)